MDRDAREAKEMTKQLPLKERLINFWYYKKWWVVSGIAAVLVIALTIYEIVTMPSYDLTVGYYSENGISDESVEKLKSELAQFSNDINDDGQIVVSITPMQAKINDDDESESDYFTAVQTRIMSELESGNNMLFICDKAYRDYLMSGNTVECFEEVFDMSERPELKEQIGFTDDTLYVLLRTLYEREEDDAEKRMEYNNARTVYEGICGNLTSDAAQQ